MAKSRRTTKLEKHIISDSVYSRRIRLLRGPAGQPQRLCLFLDGELYLVKMKVVPVLEALLHRGAIPPVTFAFLDHLNMKARAQDYTCNDQFGRFVCEKVIPWLEVQIPELRPGGHLIGGLSLSGLASAWLARQYPGHFGGCLSQSGSFWWNDQYFAKMSAKSAPASASIKTRFWLSVGDQETDTDDPLEVSQVVGVKNVCKILKSLGATIHYHEYHGGHDLKYWRAELGRALGWLLSGIDD